jgi:hypothetical protein
MRIYDKKKKEPLTNILIMLTKEELRDFIDALHSLEANNDHVHIEDTVYKRQITIGVYSPQNLQGFSPEVVRLIQEDK